ncbi:Cell division protein FtsQ [Richelia intracellularis HM01]|uniref:cell division protein FtsQ/DivIB n=1 Tax=Richelia intracellularis TaxID=1164990 RepID=UPI0002B52E0F|nr:FtsQ-type POTRA domain-containing protein [Richelia intracellularis]CCH66107.1 Cell division protein FtsQ [Richelia intracellularis HM01]
MLSVSDTDLVQRRQRLRRRRQLKNLQKVCQTLTIASIAGGLLWGVAQPMWVIKTSKAIEISGNRVLSDKFILSLINLSYPKFLLRVKPSRIANLLRKQPMITQVQVSRRLFPAGLQIEIQERIPVAIAQLPKSSNTKKTSIGLLDITGLWISLEKYQSYNSQLKLPKLKIIGLPEQYRSFWTKLYKLIKKAKIEITKIDFQDQTNLILKTELGEIHLGSPVNKLSEKIQALSHLRQLPQKVSLQSIDYIVLKNPSSPIIYTKYKEGQK